MTGGIAAYKAAELVRELVRRGAKVRVIMTDHACRFVTPLTFETLSGNPVATDLFRVPGSFEIGHIALAEFAELVVIAPATANLIGKMAAGIADDLLTTVLLATEAPVLICPAMNAKMYANPIVQENLAGLVSRGHAVLEPGYGELACRAEGQGRLAEPLEIAEEIESILTVKDLRDERILVTAGPTQEPFDPVRFISNHSSGKMGYALAVMARRRGAAVTLVSGPTALAAPRGVEFIPVRTAVEMRDAVLARLEEATVVIKAAAVADYRPAVCEPAKIKKKEGSLTVRLERNPDIISEIAQTKGRPHPGRLLDGIGPSDRTRPGEAHGKGDGFHRGQRRDRTRGRLPGRYEYRPDPGPGGRGGGVSPDGQAGCGRRHSRPGEEDQGKRKDSG